MSDYEKSNSSGEDETNTIVQSSDHELLKNDQNVVTSNECAFESDIETKSDFTKAINNNAIDIDIINELEKLQERKDEKTELEKQFITTEKERNVENTKDNIPFGEIQKQKDIHELINKAEKRIKLLKSNILSQMSELFKIFDSNHDGIIDENDLKFTFTSLGETNVPDKQIKNMINESPKPIDFHAFIGLFESKEMEFDSEYELIKAFLQWDKNNNGFIFEENIKTDLQSWGDRFSEKEIDYALEEAPIYKKDGKSVIDYVDFCANLCGLQNISDSELFKEKYLNNSKK